jgi:hypothetical protein
MSSARDRWKLFGPCLNLIAGLCWLFVALMRFDGLGGLHSRGGTVLLPSVAGASLLISATLGFRNWMRKRHAETPTGR